MNLTDMHIAALRVCERGSRTVFDFPDVVELVPGVLGRSAIKRELIAAGMIEKTYRFDGDADSYEGRYCVYTLTDAGRAALAGAK